VRWQTVKKFAANRTPEKKNKKETWVKQSYANITCAKKMNYAKGHQFRLFFYNYFYSNFHSRIFKIEYLNESNKIYSKNRIFELNKI